MRSESWPPVGWGTGVVLVSPAGTGGWRANEQALVAALERLNVRPRVVEVDLGRAARLRRLWWLGAPLVAWHSRRALSKALAEEPAEGIIAVNSTSAMLLRPGPAPVAIRIDCPAGEQFDGFLHRPHRRLERRALGRAEVAMTMGPLSSEAVRPLTAKVIEVPLGIEVRTPRPAADPAYVIAYAGQPAFKGLDLIVEAWTELGNRRGEAVLTVTGVEPAVAAAFLSKRGIADPGGIRWAGELSRAGYLDLLRGATAFVSASRLEGHGIAQLEALAAGVPLVTTHSRGAYEAEPIARRLAPALCAEPAGLADAISAALIMPSDHRADYARRAAQLLAPYGEDRTDRALREALTALGVPVPAAVRLPPRSAD